MMNPMDARHSHGSGGSHAVDVMIEIPQGSRNKYEYDRATGLIHFDRMLAASMHYPSDYGYIARTLAPDGDPLDALVLVWQPTFPGCVIRARPVGIFRMRDEKGLDDKVLCVPISDPLWNYIEQLDQVPPHLLREIEYFFSVYKDLEGGATSVEGWQPVEEALQVIAECQAAYRRAEEAAGRGAHTEGAEL